MLISKLRSHGVTINEEEAISKYLHSVPIKYIQIALSIEMMLDLSTLTIEDVTGHLWAVAERMEQATAMKDSSKLLLTEEEWAARRNSGVASSSRGGDGKRRGKSSSEKKKVKPTPAGSAGRRSIGQRSAQTASRRRRLRLIWHRLKMMMRPLS